MCRTGWMLLATALIASTRATNTENDQKAVETTQQDSVRHPREQNYREVIMFLTPSQIKHLKETQHVHGMILPTSEPILSHNTQNEEIQQQLLKQELNQPLPPQKLTLSEANHPEPRDTPTEVIQEQNQLEQHLQQQLQNQQLQNQQLQNEQLQNQQLQNQLLQNQQLQNQQLQNQQLQQQQFPNQQEQHERLQEQHLQEQQLQHNQNQVVNQHREQLFKEQILKQELERHQSQINANLLNDELHKISNMKYHEISPQQYILSPRELLRLQPENEVKQLFYPEPEFINFLQQNNNKQNKLSSQLQIQLIPQPQLEIKQLEPLLPVHVHPDYQIIPYQYAPQQQHAHQQLGQQIFKQQIQFLQNSPKNNYLPPPQQLEPVLKLNQQEEIELRKHILDHNVQSVQSKSFQENAPQLNLEVHNYELPQKENNKNENLLQNAPKIQDLGRLDLLQSLKNEEIRQKAEASIQLTHLDMLKTKNELQYAPNYSGVKFSISDIEKVIKNIHQEKQKAQATIEAIANSPPVVIKEENVVKHRPIQIIKTVKIPTPYLVPVPQPFKVAVPQPYHVPLQIIKPYAVPMIKTEKVEVERPVPYDVEKRVNVDVEKKVYVHVNKPYPVERFVPIEIKKEIPIEISVYKPKKLHILRHVW